MKRAFALPALILFSLAVLVACNTPQPLPVAPTPIATLPPATLPAAVTSTPPAALVGVTFPTTPPTAANGEKVYQAKCVSCHGADGSGVIPQAAKLNNIEFMASRPLTEFYQAVSGGKGIMPAWQDRLSSDDRWAAVEYAQSFTYKPLGQ